MSPIRVLCALLLALPAAAHAQFTVYGTYSPLHLTHIDTGATNSGESYGSFWANGVGAGVSYTVLPLGPLHLGLDLRGSTRPGTPGADTVLFGVKAGVKLPLLRLKPYLQASGGYVGSRLTQPATGSTFNTRYLGYEILGGVDYPLFPFVDLRAIEIGGGQGFNTGSFSTSNNISLFSVATGLTVHF